METNILFDTQNSVLAFAANELNTYFKKIDSNSFIFFNKDKPTIFSTKINTFSIIFEVTGYLSAPLSSHSDSFFDDQYTLQFTKEKGVITGSNSRSILLGTYKLLYLLGCRFLQPGKKYEYIPTLNLESCLTNLNINNSYTASLRHRGVCIEGANSIANVLDFIDWLPKLGYNSFFIQFKTPYAFFSRWYNHVFNPFLEKEALDIDVLENFNTLISEAMEQRGLLHHRVGHGWTCETLGISDLGWAKTNLSLEESKQDWLALIDGKRGFFKGIPTNTNLCYSNKEVQEAFVHTIFEYALAHPEINYLHIWLADEYNNLCECDDCKNTLLSDHYITLLNLLDSKLTEHHLSTKIVFLLYQELLWTPLFETFKNKKRFVLMFAPISRTFEKSYQECTTTHPIPLYERNKITLPSSLEENLSFLKNWQKQFDGDSFVYDYPLGRAHYGDVGYLSISKIISKDIKALKDLGLNGYMSCQELRVSFPNALPNYIMGLTLFNHEAHFEDLVEDYFKHIYPKDFSIYKNYLGKLSNLFSCDYFNGIGNRKDEKKATDYRQASKIAEEFLILLESNVENNYFIKKLSFHAKYVTLLATALYHLAIGDTTQAQGCYLNFCHFIQENEQSIQEALDVYRVIEVSSKYTGFTLPNFD